MRDDLESELRAMRPVGPSAAMDGRIEAELSRGEPLQRGSAFGDGMLRATLTAALAASVLIVTLLASDYAPRTTPAVDRAKELTIADTPRLLAQLSERGEAALPAAATNPN